MTAPHIIDPARLLGQAVGDASPDLVARGLSGVLLVTSDAHAGLVEAIAANLPGASWQRCRTHYAANLMAVTPKSSWGWVKALLHSVYDQPDTDAVHALVVSLDDTLATEAVRLALSAVLPAGTYEVKSWEELDDFYRKTVALYRRQFGFFQVVILLMVLLSVANSVNMSAYERTGEFGTLRALGERSSGVVRLIVTENVMLGLAGALLGAALGLLLAWAISLVGIPMPPPPNSDLGYTALIRIEPQSVLLALAIGFGATVLSALLAAFRAARVPVVDGLRWNV